MSLLFSSIVKGLFAGMLILVFAPSLARAQLFTVSSITGWWDYDSSIIRQVNPATGATISFFQWRLPAGTYGMYTTGLAAHPMTGEFFALVQSAPSPTGPICQHKLVKIDPATGASTIIGNTGACFASLAFHSNGTLYGVTDSEGAVPPSLFILDTTSATPTFLISFETVGVSSGALVGGSGLAFNPSDGLLYRSGRVGVSDQIIFQAINPNTLAVRDIPLSGSPSDGIIALTHFFGNTLLGADVGNRLFSITTEGVRTLIGPMDHLARGLAFAVTPLNVTGLTANVPSPQPPGTHITFSATAVGGTSPIEFKWWLLSEGVFSVVQNWSTNNTFSWTPALGGEYGIGVWARSSGTIDDAPENNAFSGMYFSINAPDLLSITTFSADRISPQPPGTRIVFTTTTSGGTAPIQFKWWLYSGGVFSVAKNWSTNNTFSWTPAVRGNYGIGVWVRSSGTVDDAPENNAFAGMHFSINDSCSGCWDY